ncbi:hypothetical protein [Telluribacter sp.]|uniref:hypothetical protein n=1 Tax=Telluribacter sp. TaxID=1978767 RepID=UPI002E0FA12E|nr:hypothetical protein [Telluribacter sp.]
MTVLPRSIWLSMAGGVSVSYVFLHLFPELNAGQKHIQSEFVGEAFLRHHVYLMALLGLSVFYGLERLVSKSSQKGKSHVDEDQKKRPEPGMFWLHITSFGIYNALIGYLLFTREEGPLKELILFSIAMALHFLVNDFGLYEHHRRKYSTSGRWVLVGALVLGWVTGFFIEISHTLFVLVLAFIGGGVILNVLKEELPEERESRFWAFLAGSLAYSVLLLSLG